MRSRRRQLRSLLAAFVLVLMGAAWIVLAPAQFGGRLTYVIITGNSMEPALQYGDLVLVRAVPSYQIGDVVLYRHPDVGAVIHRIIGRDGDRFIFKGDHNNWTDSYRPNHDALIGALWIQIPAAGQVVGKLRSPRNMALLTFVIGSIMTTTMGDQKRRRWLRRRRGASVHAAGTAGHAGHRAERAPAGRAAAARQDTPRSIDNHKESILFVLAVLTFVSLLLALVAFTRPLTRTVADDIVYHQSGVFSYSATAPAGVYDANQVRSGDPVFLKLIGNVHVSFAYQVMADHLHDLGGTYRLVAEIGDADGWKRTIELRPPTAFSGDSFIAGGTLDLARVQALTTALEQQSAIERHQYTLAIVPEVVLKGKLAGQDVQDSFAPQLEFQLDALELQLVRDTIRAADPLHPVQPGMLKQTHTEPNMIALLGLDLSVATARGLPLLGVVLAAAGALLFGRRMATTTHRDEAARIQFKYGPLLIGISGSNPAADTRRVEVATIDDLAKLAERDDRVILYEQHGPISHYFVQDAGVTYHYQAVQRGSDPIASPEGGAS